MKLSDDRDSSMFTCWPTAQHSARRSHYRCHYHSLLCVFKCGGRGGRWAHTSRLVTLCSLVCLQTGLPCGRFHPEALHNPPPPTNPMIKTPRNRSCYYPENYSSYCKKCDRPLQRFRVCGKSWGSDKPCAHQIRWLTLVMLEFDQSFISLVSNGSHNPIPFSLVGFVIVISNTTRETKVKYIYLYFVQNTFGILFMLLNTIYQETNILWELTKTLQLRVYNLYRQS